MDAPEIILKDKHQHLRLLNSDDAFRREDETDDAEFYTRPRMVEHLDSLALTTIETLVGVLVQMDNPAILDLMASINSHIPDDIRPSELVGIGLNEEELKANPKLTEWIQQDINKKPELPFEDNTFDVVLNVSSIQYVTQPIPLFREIGRVLKPGGLFLVVFSNRMFPTKAVNLWRDAQDDDRLKFVEEYFGHSGVFGPAETFLSMGKPRPEDDKYARFGVPSDPVFGVYALKQEEDGSSLQLPMINLEFEEYLEPEELKRRFDRIKETLECPYCGERLREWAITENPYTTWVNNLLVCINDACPYLVRGWDIMFRQGNLGTSYRLTFNPDNGRVIPVPVPNLHAIKNELVD